MATAPNGNGSKRYVTTNELKAEIDKLPTRWEVRFLILAAVIGGQFVPSVSLHPASSTLQAVRAVIGL